MRRRWLVATATLSMLSASVAVGQVDSIDRQDGPVMQVPPERSISGLTPDDVQTRQGALHAWLMTELPDGALDRPLQIRLTDDELDDVENPDYATPGPLRVGIVKPVANRAEIRNLSAKSLRARSARLTTGVLRATGDEGFVWAAAVRSDGALAVRVHFTDFSIPSDAEAYVFGVGGEAHGPYLGRGPNGTGDFWSHSIHADTAIVLVRYFGPGGAEGISGMSLRISDVGHVGADFPAFWTDNNTAAFCAYNEPCIENASGHNAPGAAEDAVALMRYISGAFIYICSGGLLADTDAGSDIPYFLTANHCISKNNEAANLETYFQYQASSPSGCLDDPFFDSFPSGLSTLGSSIVAKNRTSDYTLLQLSEQPPSGSAFLGWDASTDVANSNGTSLYRISHPAGAPQSYSEHTVDTSAPTCGSWPRGNWIYSRDDVGGTEGGSSGSPVVNGAGQVVGQLSGGCGTNVNDPCDDENNATVDGAFFAYYDQVAPYLDPGTSCTPSAEVCDDGIDNDCDSAVDCDDSDCTGDPACDTGGCINPDGAPVGDPCNSDADCCGDKCKGRPGAKTCK